MSLQVDRRTTRHGLLAPRNSLLGSPSHSAPSLRDADRLPSRLSMSKAMNTDRASAQAATSSSLARLSVSAVEIPPSKHGIVINLSHRTGELNPGSLATVSAVPHATAAAPARRSQRAIGHRRQRSSSAESAIAAVFTISEAGGDDASPFATAAAAAAAAVTTYPRRPQSASSSFALQKHAVPRRSNSSCGSHKQQQLRRRIFTTWVVPAGQAPPPGGHLGRPPRTRSSAGLVRTSVPMVEVSEAFTELEPAAVFLRPVQPAPAPTLAIRVEIARPAGRWGGVSRLPLAERRGRRGLTVQLGLPISMRSCQEDTRPDAPTEAQRDQLFGQATKLLLDRTALHPLPSDAEVTAFLATGRRCCCNTAAADFADDTEMLAASDDGGADTKVEVADPTWAVRELSQFCTLGLA